MKTWDLNKVVIIIIINISSVDSISKILCTSEVTSAICTNVRMEGILQFGTNFLWSTVMDQKWKLYLGYETTNDNLCTVADLCKITKFMLMSPVWNFLYLSTVNCRHPSQKMLLGLGVKEDGCFCRLAQKCNSAIVSNIAHDAAHVSGRKSQSFLNMSIDN